MKNIFIQNKEKEEAKFYAREEWLKKLDCTEHDVLIDEDGLEYICTPKDSLVEDDDGRAIDVPGIVRIYLPENITN